jgi:hypothetical protein
LILAKKNKCENTYFEAGDAFTIEPYEVHTVQGISDISKIVILHSKEFNEKNPDIYR